MKIKVMAIGSGEGAQVTLGFFTDDFKTQYLGISLPAEELPESSMTGDTFVLAQAEMQEDAQSSEE